MSEKHAHRTGQNLLTQNDIKDIKIKHMKEIRITKTQK